MKIEGNIVSVELCNGKFWFLEQRPTVYCSFYAYLLNELSPRNPKPVKWFNADGKENENEEDKGQPVDESDDDLDGGW